MSEETASIVPIDDVLHRGWISTVTNSIRCCVYLHLTAVLFCVAFSIIDGDRFSPLVTDFVTRLAYLFFLPALLAGAVCPVWVLFLSWKQGKFGFGLLAEGALVFCQMVALLPLVQ